MRTAAEIEASLAKLTAQLEAFDDGTPDDPAYARLGRAGLKAHHKRQDAALTRYVELTDRIKTEKFKLASAKSREESAAARAKGLTAADLDDVTHIRTKHSRDGWARVIKVNEKSVTVDDPWRGPVRRPFTAILEVRRAVPTLEGDQR